MSKHTNIMNSAFNDSISNLSHSISVNAGGLDSIMNTLYKDTRGTTSTTRSQSLQPNRRRHRHSTVLPQEKFSCSSRRSSSCDSGLRGSRHVSWGTFATTVIQSPDTLKETLNNSSELPSLPLNNNENTIGLKKLGVRAANNDIDENDMARHYNPQDCESQVPQEETSTKHVVSMSWIYEQCGISGKYTGEINSLNIPHGIGTFIADLDGSSIDCRWENGAIVVDSLQNTNRGSKIKRRGRTSPPAKSKSTPQQQPELEELSPPSPIPREESEPPVMAATSLPGYHLGHVIKHRSHMIIPQCRQEAIDNANSLQSLDFCFIKRSNGDWTYSIVADKPSNDDKAEEEREIRFVLDVKGSTKTIRRKYWGRGIRLVNTEATETILADMERDLSPQLVPKKKARQIPHQHRRKSQEPTRRRRSSQESRRSTSQPPTTPGRLDQSRRSLASRRSMGSDQAVVEGSPMQTSPHSVFSKPMVRRKTTGDLDLSFVSKTAVILPTNIQDGVNSSKDQSERSSDATLGTNLKNLYQPRPAKSPLRKSTNSLYTVTAAPQHHEAWAVVNQRGITYEQVSTKTNDGNDHYQQNSPGRPVFRTSSSCSHLPTMRKTIPFTSIQSILKNNTKSGPIRRRMSSSSMNSRVGWDIRNESDQIEESLVSKLRGDNENDQRRRGSNTSSSASLGGVALPNSSKKNSGRRRRSSLSSSASVESLSSLLRELYSPQYLAKVGKKQLRKSA